MQRDYSRVVERISADRRSVSGKPVRDGLSKGPSGSMREKYLMRHCVLPSSKVIQFPGENYVLK